LLLEAGKTKFVHVVYVLEILVDILLREPHGMEGLAAAPHPFAGVPVGTYQAK
jgi:hypothetical protein